ncbi:MULTISPECIES: hypothetical protein [unclassified Streptomyces]|uniref:hypothetical protein n=1 Tax=unclassified Streptomyces TaxID=2593676 RepID=UPI00380C5527
MTVDRNALGKREKTREFALALPGAAEEFPWGGSVTKVNGKVFVFLGVRDGGPAAELLCDRVEESCRAIAPERLVAEPDAGWTYTGF